MVPPIKRYHTKNRNSKSSAEELLNRLVHHAKTQIKRQGKVVKSFECQKIVRKLKKLEEGSGEKGKREEKLEEKYNRTKNFDLDLLVQVCLGKLGLDGPSEKGNGDDDAMTEGEKLTEGGNDGTESDGENDEPPSEETKANDPLTGTHPREEDDDSPAKKDPPPKNKNTPNPNKPALEQWESDLVGRMLQQKRMKHIMEELSQKATDHFSEKSPDANNANNKRKRRDESDEPNKSGNRNQRPNNDRRSRAVAASLKDDIFVQSLSGEVMGTNPDEEDYGGQVEEPVKKNRSGQRSRKAKMLAMQMRKEGKAWQTSGNWRPKKSQKEREEFEEKQLRESGKGEQRSILPKDVKALDVVESGKDWKEEGKAHPSWLAAKREKSVGIVEFKGKKITFD